MHCSHCQSTIHEPANFCSGCGRPVFGQTPPDIEHHPGRFQEYFEKSPQGVFVVDEQGRYIEVNPAACGITHYNEAELLQMSIADTLPSEYLEAGLAHFNTVKNSGRRQIELPFIGKGGHRGWWLIDAVCLSPTRFLGFTTDVTQRKQLDLAWKEQAEELNAIFNTYPDLYFLLAHDGTILKYRAGNTGDLYVAPEYFLGKRMEDVLPETVGTLFRVQVEKLRQGIRCPPLEYALHMNDSLHWYEARLAKQHDGKFSVIVRDITTAVQQRERLRLVLDSIPYGFFIMDRDGHYLDINKSGASLVGRTPEQLIGCRFLDAFPDAAGTVWEQTYQRVMNTNTVAVVEDYYPPLDQWYEARVYPCTEGIAVFFSEITSRKHKEAKLRAREERYAFIERAVNDGLWDWNMLTNEAYHSPRWLEIMGLPPHDMPSNVSEFFDAIHPDDRLMVESAIQRHLENRERYSVEHRVLMPDGRCKWLLSRGEVFRDAQGLPLRMAGTITDITERIIADKALRESERRLREAQSIARIGNWELDLVRNNLWWSGQVFELFELEPLQSNITYEDFLNVVHPDDRDRVNLAYTQSLRDRTPYQVTHRLLMRDGRIKYVEERCETEFDNEGTPIRSYGTIQDISEKISRDQMHHIHSQVLLSMIEAVTFVNAKGQIQFSNPACDAMFGYEPGELHGQPINIFNDATQEENKQIAHEIHQAMTTHAVWQGEFRNRKKDGTVFWTQATITRVNVAGNVSFVSVQQDITERRTAAEKAESLRAQLTHASRLSTLGQMAAGLAHELNQPLAALRLYSSAAEELARAINEPDLAECLQRIDEQSSRAAEIIRRMRSFANRGPIRRETVDLHRLIQEVAAILDYDFRRAQVHLKFELSAETCDFEGDAIQIQQVLVNLLRNACEAMTATDVNLRTITIRSIRDATHLCVRISDRGCGLEPSQVTTLFEPFRSSKASGLGLGLSICRTIIEAHDGSIGWESNQPQGATFFFSLPRSLSNVA